jgi:hypothetical protein
MVYYLLVCVGEQRLMNNEKALNNFAKSRKTAAGWADGCGIDVPHSPPARDFASLATLKICGT